MIPPIKKILTFLFAVILPLSLCNTTTVFATESISSPVVSQQSGRETAQEPSAEDQSPSDISGLSAQESPDTSTPSDARLFADYGTEEMVPSQDSILLEDDSVWMEAATMDELLTLLEDENLMKAGGYIRVTDDLVIPEEDYCIIEPKASKNMPLLVDLGMHTLYVEGEFESFGNTKYIGAGGENGLIHIRTGGSANIRSAVFEVTEEKGYAIWQEEGSLFRYASAEGTVGKVHFAQRPVAVPFSAISPDVGLPVVVVHDGQTLEDVLPKTDSVRLYWQGVMDQGTGDEDKLIPVEWDLGPYQAQLDAGERVLITGSYTDAVAFEIPVCLVVFQNGNPATFLNGYGAQSYGCPIAIVNVELAEPELECRFEWSLDGGTWFPAEAASIPSDGTWRFKVNFPQAETLSYPYYLCAVVDYPDGSVGYSDIIVFTETDRVCDSGGNRGGGTDITDSPNELQPISPDHVSTDSGLNQKQESSEHADGDESEGMEPETTPGLEESESISTISPVEETSVIGQAAPSVRAKQDRQAASQSVPETEGEASSFAPDDAEDGIPESTAPVLADSTGEMPPAEPIPSQPEDAQHTLPEKAVPIVIGGTATVTVIGAAGVYHSVGLRRRLFTILKQLLRIKK